MYSIDDDVPEELVQEYCPDDYDDYNDLRQRVHNLPSTCEGLPAYQVVENLHYDYLHAYVALPQATVGAWRAELQQRITETLPYLELDTPGARREFLIAPVLLALAARIRVAPQRNYNQYELQSVPDYLLKGKANLLIVEAKGGYPGSSFSQLCAQLIALDKWRHAYGDTIYGAMSLGSLWQFGVLHRKEKRIVQDLHLYRVPEDLPDLLCILVGILDGAEEATPGGV